MYNSLLLAWSPHPSQAESLYRSSGLVRTKGTVFLLPPSPSTLRSSFNAPPRPQTRMSSGAVALCKHFERGGASSEYNQPHPFWTLPKGSNEEKTKTAECILEKMLGDARWRNVMMLHQGVAVYEVRNRMGYGMRWTLELERDKGESSDAMAIDGIKESSGEKHHNEGVSSAPDQTAAEAGHPASEPDLDLEGWSIAKTTFRGFLEPIAEMDHELELELEN